MAGTIRSDSGRRAEHGRRGVEAPAFPLLVALFSTIAALGLFFSTTVPAIAELRHLDQVQGAREGYQREIAEALEADALHRISLEVDLQSLLVELDRRGIFAGSILSEAGLVEPASTPGTSPAEAGSGQPGDQEPR